MVTEDYRDIKDHLFMQQVRHSGHLISYECKCIRDTNTCIRKEIDKTHMHGLISISEVNI